MGAALLPSDRPKEIGISLDRPPTSRTPSYRPTWCQNYFVTMWTCVTIVQYRFGLGWPTVGRGGLRALWRIDRGLTWPAVEEGGRLLR